MALAHAAADDAEGALEWIGRAYAMREPWLVFLRVDPRFDSLSDDPRFEELAARIGLAG